MQISVIIPTLNEEQYIGNMLKFLADHHQADQFEVIVVDGGSTDATLDILSRFSIQVKHTDLASRAHQMNEGAKLATGEILYFVHADVALVDSFVDDIVQSVEKGFKSGCYRFKFSENNNFLLGINGFFTRFPFKWCRGGDQTLFITTECFEKLGGFDEQFVIMEDYDLLDRLLKKEPFLIIPKSVTVSARKYKNNSYLKVQLTNMKAMKMYRKGEHPEKIKTFYQNALAAG